jgi:hypothetical protein
MKKVLRIFPVFFQHDEEKRKIIVKNIYFFEINEKARKGVA